MANEANRTLTPAEAAKRRQHLQTLVDKFDVFRETMLDIAVFTRDNILPANPILALLIISALASAKDELAPIVLGAMETLEMWDDEVQEVVDEATKVPVTVN
jgi:hypothetical protein